MRERMIELSNYVMNSLPWGEITPDTAKRIVDRLIEDGVSIPVRCKDCKYWEIEDYEPYCNHWQSGMADSLADDFCSRGERREGE